MDFIRVFNFYNVLKKKSVFLFGARSTGKTYWIKKTIPKDTLYITLNHSETLVRLSDRPSLLNEMVLGYKYIVIDEVQKLPLLLDTIHELIEDKNIHFLMTGSSARKIKRQSANMLGGRAVHKNFFPLVSTEIPEFNLEKYLTFGGLPRIYNSEDPELELDAYLTSYFELEVKAEAYVRNLVPFHRFIKTAAMVNGELLNFAGVSSDCAVPASTVKEYFSILEDTLLGFILEPWTESKKRKAIQTAKFYFFDTGVSNAILGVKKLDRNSNLWGKSFEQFIAMELRAYLNYFFKKQKLTFWRSENKQEVDFLIGEDVAIEVKSSTRITKKHLTGLIALQQEGIFKKFYLISEDEIERQDFDIHIIHWNTFLKKLWSGEII
ncbi:MAG: ATP-binding protein [Pseudobdellovibrio sp.]